MPVRAARAEATRIYSLVPFGIGGLDEFTHESALGPEFLRQADNCRLATLATARRAGALKLTQFSDPTASKTFGTDAKYAKIGTASQLLIPAGGWAIAFSFTAVRPAAGKTAYIISSRVTGQSYHVIYASLDENGVLTVGWTKVTGAADVSIASTALTAGATTHVIAIFDAVAGTFTLYVNGVSDGTPVTAIATTEKPVQDADDWYFGVHWNPSAGPAAAVADTHFDGKLQAVTLFSLRGTRPASGTTTLAQTLVAHSRRVYPNPAMPWVLFHYDFASTSTATLYDASRHKNDGTLTGTPSNTAAIAHYSLPAHYVGYVTTPAGRGDNLVGSHGRLFYETIQAGV